MAAHSVAKAKTATLVAATADTVTITGTYRKISVAVFGTGRVSVKCNAGAATADGDDTIAVNAGERVTLYDETQFRAVATTSEGTDFVVSLISAGTPTYCVYAE